MTETGSLILLASMGIVAALLGGLITYVRVQKRLAALREENARLQATLDAERRGHEERLAAIEKARDDLAQTFNALSADALKSNNIEFLRLAEEHLKQFQIQAEANLAQKEKSIEGLVQPIREALEKTEQQVREMENERKQAYGSLTRFLEIMAQSQQELQGETRRLVQALRRPEVRGQWGELTLKRLVELAGMVEHCDFYEQEQRNSEDGALRPDMIVRLPYGREIIVDAKTPLDAYLTAIEATEDGERGRALERHARKVRERVRELAGKAYWNQFRNAPDFVVLFIPGEQFLSAALTLDQTLLEDALSQKVILATPTSFVALLRAVAYGWRQEAVTANAEKIRDLGEELYKRLAVFTEHLAKLGRHIGGTVECYNSAVGSLERQVLPGARRFTEMGISPRRPLEALEPVERAVRKVEAE
ncbi:MAG: DNA recombination protein RmuC [Gammaproteobacteria bacterium]